MEEQDPFEFLFQVSEISPSQEELLRQCPVSGEYVGSGDQAPPSSSQFPAETDGVFMLSMPETQDPGRGASGGGTQEQDVFHTPPEKSSSLPSSGDQPVDHCTLNHELDVNEEARGFVDLVDSEGNGCVNLGRDSDLGFSQVRLSQRVEEELVAQSPRGIKRDAFAEDFEGFERELCSQDGIAELPVKKSKLLEPNSGFDSSRGCVELESAEVEEEGNVNCNGNLGFGAESPCNDAADVVEPEKVVLDEEQVSEVNEVSLEKNLGSDRENAANEFECGEEKGKKKKMTSIFDVLKFLSENFDDNEDNEDNGVLENGSLLDVANFCGVDFHRPWWWPEDARFRRRNRG